MSSEHDDIQKTDQDLTILTASQILECTAQFSDTVILGSREMQDLLLHTAQGLPGVVSANLLLLENNAETIRFVWHGLDGELAEGDPILLEETPWKSAIEHAEIWIEADRPLEDLPTIEEPFLDRCLIPIRTADKWHCMLILHSNTANHFIKWDKDLLTLLINSMTQFVDKNELIRDLDIQITKYQQRSSLYPPALEGILQTSRSVLAQATPIATYLQHNFDTLQAYHRQIQETLDFYFDEIRLNASEEGLERVKMFAKHKKVKEIRSDLESLVEDSIEGVFQLKYFLNHIRELQTSSTMSEQLSFDEIIDPVYPLIFSDKVIQIARPPLDELSLYGNRTRLQHALLMLFFTVRKHIDLAAAHIDLSAEQNEDWLSFHVSYPLAHDAAPPLYEAEEYLFLRHVMEEHSGTFEFSTEEEMLTLTLHFPVMFSEYESDDREQFSMEALVLPALDSAGESKVNVDHTQRLKLMFLGTDKRFLRAIRRILAPSFEIHLASSHQAALDLVLAHGDLALILCDLQEGMDETSMFLEELQTRDPQLVPHTSFLIGERMSPEAEELAHRVSLRTLYRHTSPKELEAFIRKRARLV